MDKIRTISNAFKRILYRALSTTKDSRVALLITGENPISDISSYQNVVSSRRTVLTINVFNSNSIIKRNNYDNTYNWVYLAGNEENPIGNWTNYTATLESDLSGDFSIEYMSAFYSDDFDGTDYRTSIRMDSGSSSSFETIFGEVYINNYKVISCTNDAITDTQYYRVHFAVTRSNGVIRSYKNGTLVGSYAYDSAINFGSLFTLSPVVPTPTGNATPLPKRFPIFGNLRIINGLDKSTITNGAYTYPIPTALFTGYETL